MIQALDSGWKRKRCVFLCSGVCTCVMLGLTCQSAAVPLQVQTKPSCVCDCSSTTIPALNDVVLCVYVCMCEGECEKESVGGNSMHTKKLYSKQTPLGDLMRKN